LARCAAIRPPIVPAPSTATLRMLRTVCPQGCQRVPNGPLCGSKICGVKAVIAPLQTRFTRVKPEAGFWGRGAREEQQAGGGKAGTGGRDLGRASLQHSLSYRPPSPPFRLLAPDFFSSHFPPHCFDLPTNANPADKKAGERLGTGIRGRISRVQGKHMVLKRFFPNRPPN
jgi:hypothetical protein